MGRSNGALAQRNPLEALAQWLDELRLRQGSGMSWGQLAQEVSDRGLLLSESTLYRAAQGKKVPKWRTVQAFTQVCGGAEHKAKELWTAAHRYAAGGTDREPRGAALPPPRITELWQLVQAMEHRRRVNGNPTLRELEARALADGDERGTASHLPKSTLGAVLRGRMPARPLLGYFVRYCGNGTQDEVAEWEAAWERVRAHLRGERLPEESMRQELARVQAELAEAREQLGQTTADLARAVRTPHGEPVLVADPLPGTACPAAACSPLGQFRTYRMPATEDEGRGASLLTAHRREPGGGEHPGQAPAAQGGEGREGPAVKPRTPTRTAQASPATDIPFSKGPVAVPGRCPWRMPVHGREDTRK